MQEQESSVSPATPGQDDELEQEKAKWRDNFAEGFDKMYEIPRRKAIDEMILNHPDVISDPAINAAAQETLHSYIANGSPYHIKQAIALNETFLKNNPELFQTEEFKNLIKDHLTYNLKTNNIVGPEKILELKQRFLAEEPGIDEEFQAAAMTGFRKALSRHDAELSKQILDLFLQREAEVENLIDQSFISLVGTGNISSVQKFAQVFDLDLEKFKSNPEVIKNAEVGTIESLQGLAAMNGEFYPDDLKSAKEFYQYFFGQDKTKFLSLAQQALITSFNKSYLSNAVYLKTKVLNKNPELIETDEVKKAAQNALEYAKKEGYQPKDIELITKNFSV